MRRFRVRVYEEVWNGGRLSRGRQVKQKTFRAKDWNEAEEFGRRFCRDLESENSEPYGYAVSSVR